MDRILIIEHEPDQRNAVKSFLELSKFTIYAAQNGNEAIRLIQEEQLDLIVCDTTLPDTTASEVLKTVRNDKRTYDLPFILLGNITEDKEIRRCMNEGADDFMIKPMSAKELIKIVKARLEISKKKKKFILTEINEKWFKFVNDNINQEFLSPLNDMVNATFLMESTGMSFDHTEFNDTINAIYRSSFGMFRSTRNLIIFSTFSNNTFTSQQTQTETHHLSDVLNQILNYYNNGMTANYGQIDAEVDMVEKLKNTTEFLKVIFTELIDNAVRYDTKRLPPKVRLKSKAKGFEFTVSNNVAKDVMFELKDIEPFRKFHKGKLKNGLGLGLYICRELCLRMRYHFSMSLDKGVVTFFVSG